VPDSVSANALTVLGTMCVVVPTLLVVLVDPALSGRVPAWLLVLEAFGVFAFQTLDALDGKHARRTRTSSALGSWLDHTLDPLSVQIMLIGVASTLGVGRTWVLWVLLGSVVIGNWLLHWETSVTRVLVLGDGTSITEAQALAVLLHLVAAVVGTHLFAWSPLAGVSLGTWIATLGVGFIAGVGAISSVRRVLAAANVKRTQARVLLRALPPFVVVGFVGAVIALTSSGVVVFAMALFGSFVGVSLVKDLVLGNLVDRVPSVRAPILRALLGAVLVGGACLAGRDEAARTTSVVVASLEGIGLLVALVGTSRAVARALGIRVFAAKDR
jgi:phosphatidylglycerophosphate synthase